MSTRHTWGLRLAVGALLLTTAATGCHKAPPPPPPSPSPKAAEASPSPSSTEAAAASPSASPGDGQVGGSINDVDSPAKKDLEKGIEQYMHQQLRDAITTLKTANQEDPKNPEVVFWLFKANQDLEIKHTRQSDSYGWAVKLVAMAPGTAQGQAARDYMSAVDGGTATNNDRKGARALGDVTAGYANLRVSVVDVQNERFAGLLFTHSRNPDQNNILLTPQQWLKFVELFNQTMKKWTSVKDKKMQVGEMEGMTLSLNNAGGTTLFEILVSTTDPNASKDTPPQTNDMVMDLAGAAKLSVLMAQMNEELKPLLPQKIPTVMGPPVAEGSAPSPAAPAASPAAAASAPAPASPAPAAKK